MPIEMKVTSLAVDPNTKTPFVVLQDPEKKYALPIWIGMFEASAIATEMEKIKLARPMTHDLMKSVLATLEGELVRTEIVDLKENTYIATLVVRRIGGDEIQIDARPSDAIALALRTGSPILVHETVLEKSQSSNTPHQAAASTVKEQGKWQEILENLPSEAFGKYKM
jgi:uncharacterized protein